MSQSGSDVPAVGGWQQTRNISIESTPKQSKAWIVVGVIVGLCVIAVLVWFFVIKEDDAAAGGADPNASSEGGCKDGEEMVGTRCLVKCADGKIRVGEVCQDKPMLKIQTMNIATMHAINGMSDIYGSLIHSGILKSIKLTAKAKDQGWVKECSSFHLNIIRDGKSIAGISQNLGRNEEYKSFSLDPEVIPGTLVQEGDIVRMRLDGTYCSTWIKDIVVEIKVLV